MTNLDSILKSRDITWPTKVRLVKAMVFPVVMYGWELDCEKTWALKNWCFQTVVLEKTLQSPLDCKESQPVHPKRDQSWVFIGRTDVEAETLILWPPDAKRGLIGKDLDAGYLNWIDKFSFNLHDARSSQVIWTKWESQFRFSLYRDLLQFKLNGRVVEDVKSWHKRKEMTN